MVWSLVLRAALLISLLVLFPSEGSAKVLSASSLYSMTLEELMQVEVKIASKTSEEVKAASSSVTVFTRDEIKALGMESVYDVLNYVPGMQVTRSVDIVDEPLIHVRGRAHIDGDVLVLLNGHRLNENSFGRATLINRYISTDMVKRIEVIRGPGSALYGSNAFLGVINVITVDDENSAGVTGGKEDRIAGFANVHKLFSNGLNFSGSISYYNDDGQDYRLEPGVNTSDPSHNMNLYARMKWAGLICDLGYMEYKNQDFITFNSVAPEGITWSKSRYYLASLDYRLRPAPRLSLITSVTYTRQVLEVVGLLKEAAPPGQPENFYVGPYSQSSYYEVTLDGEYEIGESHRLFFGGTYRWDGIDFLGAYSNYITPDGYALIPREEYYLGDVQRFKDVDSLDGREKFLNVLGFYGEYKGSISDKWTVVLGGRYDTYSLVGEAFNPRVSLLFQASQDTIFKLFYGTAFRVATTQELFTDSPRSKGNKALEPEEVDTVELVVRHSFDSLDLEGVWFHNYIHNIIALDVGGAPDGRNTWVNQGSVNLEGVEARLVWQPVEGLRTYLTYTHLFSQVEENTYRDFASYILDYHMGPWRFNLNGIVRMQPHGTLDGQGDYFTANSKVSYSFRNNFQWYCAVYNLFDLDYDTYETKLTRFQHAVPNSGIQWRIGIEARW